MKVIGKDMSGARTCRLPKKVYPNIFEMRDCITSYFVCFSKVKLPNP